MALPMKTMTNYFLEIGADKVAHSEKTYLAHTVGTYRNMKEWGAIYLSNESEVPRPDYQFGKTGFDILR